MTARVEVASQEAHGEQRDASAVARGEKGEKIEGGRRARASGGTTG
jgi:hypothetical protein